MNPAMFFSAVVMILVAAVVAERLRLRRHRTMFRALGRRWQMHYAAADRLRLAGRIAAGVPVPGAANIRVFDLLFRTQGTHHEYLFTVEYTVGVIRGKVGRQRVVGFQEPVSRGGRVQHFRPVLTLAPRGLTRPAAYEYVRDALARSVPAP